MCPQSSSTSEVFEEPEISVDERGLGRLSDLFREYSETGDRVEELKAELKAAEEARRRIEEERFPELFDEVGVSSFTVGNRKVTLVSKLYGSLPIRDEEARDAALAEIDRLGGSDIRSAKITLSYPKGKTERAREVVAMLRDAGEAAKMDETIHPSTYQAFVREQIAAGSNPDLDVLKVYNRRFVKVE